MTITPAPPLSALAARYQALRDDPACRAPIQVRAAVLAALRGHLHRDGFLEIDTPLLQHAPHASPDRPLRVTTRRAPGPLFLRSSPLYLRGMLTAFDRVYEIGRTFRDEPADTTHSPEYTLVELYAAGSNHIALYGKAQALIATAARAAAACAPVELLPAAAELTDTHRWPILNIYTAVGVALHHGISPGTHLHLLRDLGRQAGISCPTGLSADETLLHLYDHLVEPTLITPTFVTGFPTSCSPLAERDPEDHYLAQKWDLVIAGREIATGYTELADATELRRRLRTRSAEADTVDNDLLEVADLGIPPAGGLCIGLDRLLLTLTGAATVHDVVPIPLATT